MKADLELDLAARSKVFFDVQLERYFHQPIHEFLNRPGRNFRADLFRVCSRWFSEKSELGLRKLEAGVALIEKIHAGSLVIDDIQDESRVRRGRPSLHLEIGTARAINIGNALYFIPLVDIASLGLNVEQELRLYRWVHQTLVEAHLGQALDLSIPVDGIPQEEVGPFCLKVSDLKTGTLTGLAVQVAGALHDASESKIRELSRFGRGFGVALQNLNDTAEFVKAVSQGRPTEDLIHRRPGWIWHVAATTLNRLEYQSWVDCFRAFVLDVPDAVLHFQIFVQEHQLIERAEATAEALLQQSLDLLHPQQAGELDAKADLVLLAKRLVRAHHE